MVKVINQDIPAEEVTYDPDPARPTTIGQMYQQAVTEGATGTTPPGSDIVRKSPITGRPSSRGPGTPAQQPQRECFKACGEVWRNLPDYFRQCVKDIYNENRPPPKDKDIPLEWFSTPWSTFLRECLKYCRSHGPENMDPNAFFNCPDIRCEGVTIGYTTTQMAINEIQQLSVEGGGSGSYTWSILSGAGSITQGGLYTAPASNENCSGNPVINLVDDGAVCASLSIAINVVIRGDAGGYLAYCSNGGTSLQNRIIKGNVMRRHFKCNGDYVYGTEDACDDGFTYDCSEPFCEEVDVDAKMAELCTLAELSCNRPEHCPQGCEFGIHDVRTEDLLAAGCCPWQLL